MDHGEGGARCPLDREDGQHGAVCSAMDCSSTKCGRFVEGSTLVDLDRFVLFSDLNLSLTHHYRVYKRDFRILPSGRTTCRSYGSAARVPVDLPSDTDRRQLI